jgi:two-component system, sensor histidine kinase and response regulator
MNDSPVILNVDDYTPGRYARTRMLRQSGFEVCEAATGADAILSALECHPALILLDVNLPDMSGFDVCRQLRQNPITAATTVVHLSATSVGPDRQVEGLNAGADGYLVEPIEPAVLVATIRALLRARKAEEALRRSNEELAAFGYRVAHDLNEPLRTMVAHTQLLSRKLGPQLSESNATNLQMVVDAAGRMQTFIDSLLAYSRATHTEQRVKLNCENILDRVCANLAESIKASGAVITRGPLPMLIAEPCLEQVFQNLVSNAIKYAKPEVPPVIHVSARPEGEFWTFQVRDNGVGIEASQRDNVFQVFHRLHGQEIPGSGIGLALSKRVVEAHSGNIWVESEPGKGSTFYFRIPAAPGDLSRIPGMHASA